MKIIVRSKVVSLGNVGSSAIMLFHVPIEKLVPASIKRISSQTILRKVFEDEIETKDVINSKLYQQFLSVKSSKIENEEFKIMSKINDEFAVHTTQHLYLYRLAPNLPRAKYSILSDIIPWYYAESKKFLGDAWWYTDDEVIEDIKKMPTLDFLKKYKGYAGWG
jgi:hypothetical protein